MLNISSNVKNAYLSDSAKKDYIFTIKNASGAVVSTITNSSIVGETVSITESICDSGDIVFGKCNAAELSFTCADLSGVTEGMTVTAKMRASGLAANDINMGVYTISTLRKSADRRFTTVTAYDYIKNLDIDVSSWYSSLVFPMTLKAFRDSLFSHVGVAQDTITLVNDTISISKTIDAAELSGKECVEKICELNGVFGVMTRSGVFRYMSIPAAISDTISKTQQRNRPEYEDYTVPSINSLIIRQSNDDVGATATVGNGNNKYVIEGNWLAYGLTSNVLSVVASNILAKITGLPYTPLIRAEIKGAPWLELGDKITIVTASGNNITTYILKRTLDGVQAQKDSFSASGEARRNETFGVGKRIKQLNAKYNNINDTIEEHTQEIADISSAASSAQQTATTAITKTEQNARLIELSASLATNTTALTEHSPTYNMSLEDAEKYVPVGTVYFTPTTKTETLSAGIQRSFLYAYTYTWTGSTYGAKYTIMDYSSYPSTKAYNYYYTTTVTMSEYTFQAGHLYSYVNGVLTDITYTNKSTAATMKIAANSISQIVTSIGTNGEVTPASIISAINGDTSTIKISADKLELSGETTFLTADDLGAGGSTVIDGGRLATGTLTVDRIYTGTNGWLSMPWQIHVPTRIGLGRDANNVDFEANSVYAPGSYICQDPIDGNLHIGTSYIGRELYLESAGKIVINTPKNRTVEIRAGSLEFTQVGENGWTVHDVLHTGNVSEHIKGAAMAINVVEANAQEIGAIKFKGLSCYVHRSTYGGAPVLRIYADELAGAGTNGYIGDITFDNFIPG